MAYTVINSTRYDVGKAIKQDLFDDIVNNLDDHESRITLLETGGAVVEIFNSDVLIGSNVSTVTGIHYAEILKDMELSECAIQIYEKGSITGTLSIDVKKNTTPDNTGMTSVFTSVPTIVFASSTDYQRNTGTFNPAQQAVIKGDILRLDISSLPAGLGKFRVVLFGVI